MTKAERVLSLNGKFIAVVNVDVDREGVVLKDVILASLQHVSTIYGSHHRSHHAKPQTHQFQEVPLTNHLFDGMNKTTSARHRQVLAMHVTLATRCFRPLLQWISPINITIES